MTENPDAGRGMVVLDIGGDVGAVLVSAPADLVGAEVEICPSGHRDGPPDDGGDWWVGEWHTHSHDDSAEHAHSHDDAEHGHSHDHAEHAHAPELNWPHVSILARSVGGGHSAIFPGLRTGSYDLWIRPNEPTALTVEVVGGQVTTASWPGTA